MKGKIGMPLCQEAFGNRNLGWEKTRVRSARSNVLYSV
jgi:hypothetical protein